ncbi:MAG TPA: glycoside hydrolase family 3 N-terminal domain-containing protein [Bryobacteraceae bacterium]|nr:glycoside hydrolase family 3 N-terminal domain-containing protein [Bryobacteraceae bacterium]
MKPVVRRWLSSLTLSQKVAQLVVIPFYGEAPNTRSRQYQRFLRLVREQRVGGLVLINRSRGRGIQKAEPYAVAAFLNRMQRIAAIPLLVAGDFERGASMRIDGTTLFPHAMAFAATGDPKATRYEGEITARDSRALGVHWIFFPVADVNSNPDNPVINIRSFGENPKDVAAHVRAFIEGARDDTEHRVLTTAKHFPGHGDTAVDSHLAMPSIQADRAHLETVEMTPFRAAIESGVDSVMTAHIALPALEAADVPATLSPAIMTGLLRDELNFKGLVVTDALEMGGVVKGFSKGEAAVRAIEAGADVLLMPPDPETAIRAVVAAVRSGRLTVKRIDRSVTRVLEAKQSLGLDRSRLVNLEAIADIVNSPEAAAKAQEIADHAVTLVRNGDGLVPLRDPKQTAFLILTESRYGVQGQAIQQELAARGGAAQVITLDPAMPDSELDAAAERLAPARDIVVMAFASAGSYRGDLSLPGGYPRLIETLLAREAPVTLVSLGSPYLVRSFPKAKAYLTTYSPVPTSEAAAVKALFGEIDIRGHLPVRIPEVAEIGFGIDLPRRAK